MSLILDIGGILAAIAAILAAYWSHQAKKQVGENNGGSTLKDASDRQELALSAILSSLGSVGHQIGEVRGDMGRMDDRLTGEVQELRRRVSGG